MWVPIYVTPLNRATYEEVFAARLVVEQWATAPAIAHVQEADIERLCILLVQARITSWEILLSNNLSGSSSSFCFLALAFALLCFA